jgi:HD-like signal output (HDOD) protein
MIAEFTPLDGSTFTAGDIVREVKCVPSAPKVLPRLRQLLSDANSPTDEIVAMIRLDAGMAAQILRVANSAYFSKGVRCFTVDDAVNRVGYDQIYELVSLAVAAEVLSRPLVVYGLEADDLWRMSVAGALAAEALAVHCGQDRDVAYTVGLLHCVGMVAVHEWAVHNHPSLRLALIASPRDASENERAVFGFTQADTGAALLRQWGFPPSITDPIRCQYAPRSSASAARMAALLFAAKWLRNTACGAKLPLPEPPQLAPLPITPATLRDLGTAIPLMLEGIVTRLDLKPGRSDRGFPSESSRP